ncbi:MAG TPA: pantoate--beta-alanine ligase [Bdellovibrionales bacterium]|nr:pantoate--beta-alanine ligase [Bdellovibrionales bacterium]
MRQVPGTPRVFENLKDWFQHRHERRGSLGFVPTMGALHEGHLELVRRARAENAETIVSIFVNPTQFDDPNDLNKYPRTFERDLELLRGEGVDYVLYPKASEMYADQYRFKITENQLSRELCGAHRPGHFDGVLTVVMKLLQIAGADRAYFGEKDFQQYTLVKDMAAAFFLRTQIVGCPTVREEDGLAMSSRNTRLSEGQRQKAAAFPRILSEARGVDEARAQLRAEGFEVDYVEQMMGRRFGAVRLGEVRLIDNIEI